MTVGSSDARPIDPRETVQTSESSKSMNGCVGTRIRNIGDRWANPAMIVRARIELFLACSSGSLTARTRSPTTSRYVSHDGEASLPGACDDRQEALTWKH